MRTVRGRRMRNRNERKVINDLFIRTLFSKFNPSAVSEIMSAFMNSVVEFKFDLPKIAGKLKEINYSCHLIDKIFIIAKNCKIEFV